MLIFSQSPSAGEICLQALNNANELCFDIILKIIMNGECYKLPDNLDTSVMHIVFMR